MLSLYEREISIQMEKSPLLREKIFFTCFFSPIVVYGSQEAKFSEIQKSYYSYVQDQVSCFGISSVVGDTDRQEMLAAVLEAMAYHSYKLVRPAYYETALSERYMQDPQSKEVLDTIFDTLCFDFSSSCSNIITGCVIRDNLRPILSGTNTNISSSTRSWQRQVERALEKYNAGLAEIGG